MSQSEIEAPDFSPSFEGEIEAIFFRHCVECHGIEAEEAGLDLRTRKSILAGGDSGPAIVPGQTEGSLLLEMIEDDLMPPEGDLLSAAEIQRIRQWIAMGANP